MKSQFATDRYESVRAGAPMRAAMLLGAAPEMGQRQRALEVTRQCPPGSVGAAIRPVLEDATEKLGAVGSAVGSAPSEAIHAFPVLGPMLRAFGVTGGMSSWDRAVDAYAREFAAGRVGEFYEQQRPLLNQPATRANIAEFARRETEFFERESSFMARAVASIMSEQKRAALIEDSARQQGVEP